MDSTQGYILGNGALHERFFATTEILAKLVSSAPRAISISQLEDATGRSARELGKLCVSLQRAGLLEQEAGGKWMLACAPSAVTLEDVFRCVLSEQQTRTKLATKDDTLGRISNDVDLLITQAMIAVNQSISKHLRQFSLDRLKISAAGMFPAVQKSSRSVHFDDAFDNARDVTAAGREANHVSFMPIAA